MGRIRGALAALIACTAASIGAPDALAGPYSSHSQLYACCTDSATKDALFREAKASGAAYIRVDVAMEAVLPEFAPPERLDSDGRDWSGLDEVAALSESHDLAVVAVLQGTPRQMAACLAEPWWERRVCPPAEPERWAALAADIAARYEGRIDHFQIWNEPDGQWAFRGSAEDYGRMLAAAYPAIRERAPAATVVLGGLMEAGAEARAWLDRALAVDDGAPAHSFDVAAIHYRGPLEAIAPTVRDWRDYLSARGLATPLWVTEHGYPSDAAWQTEPGLTGGEDDQATYLSRSLPAFVAAGAEQVFVTLHDGGGGAFDSEGILAGMAEPGGEFRRKPAWYAVLSAPLTPPAPVAEPEPVAPPPAPPAAQSAALGRPCAARRTGTRRGDRLMGTVGGDRLIGRRGRDILHGRAGEDCLSGGIGSDRIRGGPGLDRLAGGPGRDRINAADGVAETVRCGRGVDLVRADDLDRLIGCERVRREPEVAQ